MRQLIKKHFFTKEFVGYVLVGSFGAVIDFSMFGVLIIYEHSPLISQWLAGLSAFSFTHIWHHYFIFKHNQKLKKTYFLSLIFNLTSIALSGPFLWYVTTFVNVWLAKILVTVFFTMAMFFIRKKLVFVWK